MKTVIRLRACLGADLGERDTGQSVSDSVHSGQCWVSLAETSPSAFEK